MASARDSAPPPARKSAKLHRYPAWSPRFWHGMRFGHWWRLLCQNRFRVHPTRIPMAVLISLITPFNSVMARGQQWRYGARIQATELPQAPLFIVGHWRSGTTLLHELLTLDPRFNSPTTYQCFAPEHFLLTQWLFANYFGFLLPKKRPMDDVRAGWHLPQEDEFALLTMGCPTPYRRMAFPRNGPTHMEYLNLEGLSDEQRAVWEQTLMRFVRTLTYANPRRLVLKSPTHTGRVGYLARLFPGAQFIHITRHPCDIFPSTRRLWNSLERVQGCQLPDESGLDAYIFDAFDRLYGGFHAQRATLPADVVYDLRYEDLVADPVHHVERLYDYFKLGDFAAVRPALEHYAEQHKDYRTNQHQVDSTLAAELRRRWHVYFQRYGYAEPEGET